MAIEKFSPEASTIQDPTGDTLDPEKTGDNASDAEFSDEGSLEVTENENTEAENTEEEKEVKTDTEENSKVKTFKCNDLLISKKLTMVSKY